MRTVLLMLAVAACSGRAGPAWRFVDRHLPAALLSVWGTAADDVYAVGGDTGDGTGPLFVHFDGTSWARIATGHTGNLWWVTGAGGAIFLGGDGGAVLRYEAGAVTKLTTPGTGTVFGIWAASETDVWAVGGAIGGARGAFAWRLEGQTFTEVPGFPTALTDSAAIWKMYGRSANDAWMVGTNGALVRWDGQSLTSLSAGTGESLFTVHADASRYVAVGGFGTGLIVENAGAMWENVSPTAVPGLVGVVLSDDDGYAVGQEGTILRQRGPTWELEDLGVTLDETLHSAWIDPDGGVWAVGGQVLTLPLVDGVMMYRGDKEPGSIQ